MGNHASGMTRVNQWVDCPQPHVCRAKKHRMNSAAYVRCARRNGKWEAYAMGTGLADIHDRQSRAGVLDSFNKAVSGPAHTKLVNDFKRKRIKRDTLREELDQFKADIKSGKRQKTKAYYRLSDRLRQASLEEMVARKAMNDNLNRITFNYFKRMAESGRGADVMLDWFNGELPGTSSVFEGESGSIEWLKARQKGIGGSDAGTIILGSPSDRNEMVKAKLEDITEAQEGPQSVAEMNAIHRGNMMEAMNALEFQAQNPHLHLMRDKRTYTSESHPHLQANFDGLVFDDSGELAAVWESKTTDNWAEWIYTDENGVEQFCIPPKYQAQLDHQMMVAGTDLAYITVKMNGNQTITLTRERGEPIRDWTSEKVPRGGHPTYEGSLKKLDEFWDKVENREVSEPKPRKFNIPDQTPQRKKDFSESSGLYKVVKGFLGKDDADTYMFGDFLDEETGEFTEATIKERIEAAFAEEKIPEGSEFVYFDTETTGFSRSEDEIIEFYAVRYNAQGEKIDEFHELYSPDERFLDIKGTGAEHIHGISPDDVRGKSVLRDDEAAQKRLTDFLRLDDDSTVLVGHNNYAFDNQMLDHAVPGLRRGLDRARSLDTMVMSQYFLHDTQDNTLASAAEHFGVDLSNHHRADADAEAGVRVLFKMMDQMGVKR